MVSVPYINSEVHMRGFSWTIHFRPSTRKWKETETEISEHLEYVFPLWIQCIFVRPRFPCDDFSHLMKYVSPFLWFYLDSMNHDWGKADVIVPSWASKVELW